MAEDSKSEFTARLKAVATALGMVRYQQLPTPPDHRVSKAAWEGILTSRNAHIAGKLWESLNGEIDAGGFDPNRKRAKTFDLNRARELLGTRDDFVALAEQQFQRQNSAARSSGETVPAVRRIPERPFKAEWILFAPFCPNRSFATEVPRQLVFVTEDKESRTFGTRTDPNVQLRWFPWGGAVWTIRSLQTFQNLAAAATKRREMYRSILKGNHLIRKVTDQICNTKPKSGANIEIGYVLSMFFLTEPGWSSELVPHALQVLSCPNILLELPEVEDCDHGNLLNASAADIEARERDLLQRGVEAADLYLFNQPGLVTGYACWAGVAAQIKESLRPRMLTACISFQQELQSLWWRLHTLCASQQSGQCTPEAAELAKQLRLAVQRTLQVGPTEVTALRLFKEAVIHTSRFRAIVEAFHQVHTTQ